jgi:hypothetical protein
MKNSRALERNLKNTWPPREILKNPWAIVKEEYQGLGEKFEEYLGLLEKL